MIRTAVTAATIGLAIWLTIYFVWLAAYGIDRAIARIANQL